MRKVVIVLFGFFILFGVCGCDVFQDSHYIPNGKYYYDDDTYMKIKDTDVELYSNGTLEAYGSYTVSNDVITITYNFRKELDKSSKEYDNVVPYNREDTAHLDEDTIIIDTSSIDRTKISSEEEVFKLKK